MWVPFVHPNDSSRCIPGMNINCSINQETINTWKNNFPTLNNTFQNRDISLQTK
jgi:hypothetical protein